MNDTTSPDATPRSDVTAGSVIGSTLGWLLKLACAAGSIFVLAFSSQFAHQNPAWYLVSVAATFGVLAVMFTQRAVWMILVLFGAIALAFVIFLNTFHLAGG